MIGVTGNAACSIALRNAVFKGVPKAFWSDIYEAARRAAVGDIKTLANKRKDALDFVQKMGATPDMVVAALGVGGIQDIGLDELATLKGIITAIRDGETTVEQAFAPRGTEAPQAKGQKPSTSAPQAKATAQAEVTQVPVAAIRSAIDSIGIPESEFCAHFEIGTIEELPLSSVAAANEYLAGLRGA
jgi:hypothetical protein